MRIFQRIIFKLKLKGTFMDIMCNINLEHKNNVRYEKLQKVLYMLVFCAIYGCIELALQWYKLYLEKLTEKGLKLNLYEICVANKLVNGKQYDLV